MAEFYSQYGTGGPKEKRRALWLVVLDMFMWAFTATTLFAATLILAGRYISPERLWYFSLLGLFAPMVYVAVLLAMFYWIIRWRWIPAGLSALFAVIGLFHASLYYKLDFTKQYGEPQYDASAIKVMTFNIRSCHDDAWESTVDSVVSLVRSTNPDIVCFQEYMFDSERKQQLTDSLSNYKPCSTTADNWPSSIECFSKYPAFGARKIEDLGGTGVCASIDLCVNDDTIRLYNAHLQTTSVSIADRHYINNAEFIGDSIREERFTNIARSLRDNNKIRARQAELLESDMAQCPYPMIVCGDFNDVPVSYTYRKIVRGLDDTFREKGHGYANTFRGFLDLMRIDYILVSPYFKTLSYDVLQTGDISDHYPVFVRLKQTSKP